MSEWFEDLSAKVESIVKKVAGDDEEEGSGD